MQSLLHPDGPFKFLQKTGRATLMVLHEHDGLSIRQLAVQVYGKSSLKLEARVREVVRNLESKGVVHMDWMPGTKARQDHDEENAIMVIGVFLGPRGRTEHGRGRVAEEILSALSKNDGLLIRELAERTKSPLDVIRHAVPDLRARGLIHTQWDLVKTGPRVGRNRNIQFEGGSRAQRVFLGADA